MEMESGDNVDMISEIVTESEENLSSGELSPTECFDILSNHRRRQTLYYLKQNGGEVSLDELARGIAAWENNSSSEEVTYNERKRVYTSLQQVHLPRMNKMDIIEFDEQAKTVKIGPSATEIDAHLEVIRNNQKSWEIIYFGLALLNLGAIGVVSLGGSVVDLDGGLLVAVFCVTTFLVTSLLHIYDTR